MTTSTNTERAKHTFDLVFFIAIAAVLAGLHFLLPQSIQDQLVFQHANLNPLTMWTSAFVHLDNQHLFSNLQGYATAIAPLYILYWHWGRRRDLRRAVLLMLLVFPFLVSGASYLVFRFVYHASEMTVTRGFSGIVGALAGFLFASLVAFLADRYGRFRGLSAGMLMLLVALGALLFSVSAVVTWWEMGLVVFGIVLEASILVPREVLVRPGELRRVFEENWEAFGLVVYGFLAVVVLVLGLFPAEVVHEGGMTNIFGHGVGFGLGAIFGLVGFVEIPRI